MTFDEILEQAIDMLQRRGRVSYGALKRQFALEDDYLADLKSELVDVLEVAADKDGKMLVWTGEDRLESSVPSRESKTALSPDPRRQTLDPRPITYTPAHLAERIRAEQTALEARGVTGGERKTITALFADLKGSTALIEGLDPEEAQRVIDPALQLMMDAVHQYEGFVAQPLGDGIFALFGAPLAHEDHPQRALYAALRMQETMRRYADTLRQQGYPPLPMRVGVNTGEVVLRSIRKDDLRADYVPVGHSTNLAARMEQLATPGSIVVSAYTHRLTDGYFAFKDLGPTQIKGVADALNIYELLGLGQLRTRLQVGASRYGLTRFVGRHSEMDQLKRALEQAKTGHGQIVGTMGEPGLGKSRLFHEFKLLSLGGCLVLEAYSVSHGKATAYLPVIELLKSYFDIKGEDDERKRREKVNGKVLTLDRTLEDTLPYLFALLGIEEQPSPLAQMDPQIRRRRTFEALKKLFLRESLNQPLVLIFEDLHWIDGETQGFLDTLSESLASAKLLLLTNYRPEYKHEWGQKTYYTQLRLAPFGKEEAEEFLDVLLGESPCPIGERDRVRGRDNNLQTLKQLIIAKTQGTPFFMEEIVQELREQGLLTDLRRVGTAHQPLDLHLPTTVQAVLAARIDRLAPDEKALLQQLAVIGRQFPLSLIRQVIAQPEADLYRLLASLQHKEFLYEQPAFPESEYLFKHALTQEVAYGTVLQEQKKLLHERTGQAIEQLYKGKIEEHYGELAHHYQRSGNTERTVHYCGLAADVAIHQSAYAEAASFLTAAVEKVGTLPDTEVRQQQELSLQISLGTVFQIVRGPGSREAEQAYAQARALCEQIGAPEQRFSILRGLWQLYSAQADVHAARQMGEQLHSLAQQAQEPSLLLEAHRALGEAAFFLGEYVLSRQHFEAGLALLDGQSQSSLIFRGNAKTACHSRLARTLHALGYLDQARRHSQLALAFAREHADPLTLASSYYDACTLYCLLQEWHTVRELGEALVTIAQERGSVFHLAASRVVRGLASFEQEAESSLLEIREGLKALQAAGATLPWAVWSPSLAETCAKVGRVEESMAVLEEAFILIQKTGARLYEAELYRLKGELTLQSKTGLGQVEGKSQTSRSPSEVEQEAEACFLKAIQIAQKQQAKSLELRAATSLARVWQSQGKPHAARNMLADVYNWFTEGFDTKDLQEAKALLDELKQQ